MSVGRESHSLTDDVASYRTRALHFWLVFAGGWAGYVGVVIAASRPRGFPLTPILAIVGPFALSVVVASWRRKAPRPESTFARATAAHLSLALVYSVLSARISVSVLQWASRTSVGDMLSFPTPGFSDLVILSVILYALLAGFLEWMALADRMRLVRELAMREAVLRAQAEVKALRSSFNPHFVFNTLHSLLQLVRSDPERAEDAIEDVADLIRYASVLDGRDSDTVTLREELEVAKKYVSLEKLRLADRLRVDWQVEPGLEGVVIPAFSLQIILENAIKHGISPIPEGGAVSVKVTASGVLLRIEVTDDGVGANLADVQNADGHGLSLLRQQLTHLFESAGSLVLDSEEGRGFTAVLEVPLTMPGRRTGEDVSD